MPPSLIRDLSDTSGYWAAVWTMCTMPDVHVIADAPVGCFNLVATAVPDYTDAIPHIENMTPATITEQEVGAKVRVTRCAGRMRTSAPAARSMVNRSS